MAEPQLYIQGKEGGGRWENEADKVTASRMKPVYESKEFAVGIVADHSLKNDQGGFALFSRAHTAVIRTNQDISIKLNNTANDIITLTAGEGVLTLNIVELTDIFFTTTVATTIKVLLV